MESAQIAHRTTITQPVGAPASDAGYVIFTADKVAMTVGQGRPRPPSLFADKV